MSNKIHNLKLGGVGSVFTLDKARGKGHMSQNINEAIDIMKSDGYDLSWLSGERYRYSNYGWDFAGKEYRMRIRLKDLKRYYKSLDEVKYIDINTEDGMALIKELYDSFEIGVVRDDDLWNRHLNRKNIKWILGSIDKKSKERDCAYMVVYGNENNFIPEIQGDEITALKLLLDHMESNEVDEVILLRPYDKSEVTDLFAKVAEQIEIRNIGSMRIVNIENLSDKLGIDLSIGAEEIIKTRLQYWNKCFDDGGVEKISWWISTLDMV